MNQHFDCIIIGAGISGITAAIYLKRANYNVVLIEENVFGGQINKTSRIENYPGYSFIDGPSFVMNLYNQIKKLEIPIYYNKVIDVRNNNDYEIITDKDILHAKGLIIASGRTPLSLNIEKEQKLIGRGISYCALCDGMFFKGKDVVVVGGGNSAFEESLYLSDICSSVIILNRSDRLKASKILIDQVKKRQNITVRYNSSITKINEKDNMLYSVEVNGEEIKCQGLFIYIGSIPNIKYLENLNLNQENNYLIVDNNMRTNLKNVYACGDVIKKEVYQIITAASDGAKAAVSFGKDVS